MQLIKYWYDVILKNVIGTDVITYLTTTNGILWTLAHTTLNDAIYGSVGVLITLIIVWSVPHSVIDHTYLAICLGYHDMNTFSCHIMWHGEIYHNMSCYDMKYV